MNPLTERLAWWWPKEEQLRDILLRDAIDQSPAVTLAVHQPMKILCRPFDKEIGDQDAVQVDEHALLERLREEAWDGCQLLLIEGKSGTGKSHLVNWLKAKLEALADRDKRVVIPVFKGSRLRDIVKALNDRPELAGPEHAELRHRLDGAQEAIEPEDAANRLCNQLATVCRIRYENAQKLGSSALAMDRLYLKWGNTRLLPTILVNEALRRHLCGMDRPMRKLVEHFHAKATVLAPRDKTEFCAADLVLPDVEEIDSATVRWAIGQLEKPANGSEAAQVLNDALDEAKRVLIGLQVGAVTEVFQAIRRALFAQGKELVLLVEDFADLSGLQNEMLQAAIQTRAPDGVPTFCTLRTVLAYTNGYLQIQKGTVLSRAERVYYLPSEGLGEGVPNRVVDLIARYLRAARFGKATLDQAMLDAPGEDWLPRPPRMDEELEATLAAFGACDGTPLFPFSRESILALLNDKYWHGHGGAIPFIPREIVTTLMKRVLDHRASFLEGTFPSEAFQTSKLAQLTISQANWLNTVTREKPVKERLQRFLPYWGIEPTILEAFGLPKGEGQADPEEEASTKTGPSKEPVETDKKGKGAPREQPEPPPKTLFENEWALFERWRRGAPILGTDRNDIRKAMDRAFRQVLGWSWMPHEEPSNDDFELYRWKLWHEGLEFDGMEAAKGSLTIPLFSAEARTDQATNHIPVLELTALFAARQGKLKSWDCVGIEPFLAAQMSFLERYRPAIEKHILGLWHAKHWDAVPWLVEAIQYTGAALGMGQGFYEGLEDFVTSLFAPAGVGTQNVVPSRNQASLVEMAELRRGLQRLLSKEIGAFQGSGNIVHAYDVIRLQALFTRDMTPSASRLPLPDDLAAGAKSPELELFRKADSILKKADSASKGDLLARRGKAASLRALLGPEPEPGATLEAIAAFRLAGLKALVLAQQDAEILEQAVIDLEGAPVVEALLAAERLPTGDPTFWARLVGLAENDPMVESLNAATRVLEDIDEILSKVNRRVPATNEADPLQEAREAHEQKLTQTRTLLDEMFATFLRKESL